MTLSITVNSAIPTDLVDKGKSSFPTDLVGIISTGMVDKAERDCRASRPIWSRIEIYNRIEHETDSLGICAASVRERAALGFVVKRISNLGSLGICATSARERLAADPEINFKRFTLLFVSFANLARKRLTGSLGWLAQWQS